MSAETRAKIRERFEKEGYGTYVWLPQVLRVVEPLVAEAVAAAVTNLAGYQVAENVVLTKRAEAVEAEVERLKTKNEELRAFAEKVPHLWQPSQSERAQALNEAHPYHCPGKCQLLGGGRAVVGGGWGER